MYEVVIPYCFILRILLTWRIWWNGISSIYLIHFVKLLSWVLPLGGGFPILQISKISTFLSDIWSFLVAYINYLDQIISRRSSRMLSKCLLSIILDSWVIFSWWSPIQMSGMFYLSVTLRLIHPCRDSIWRSFYPLPILGTKIEFPIFFVPLWLRLRLLPVNWRSWFEVQWLVSSTNEAWLMVLLVGVVVLSDFFNSLSYIYLCTFMYRCQLHHVGLKIHYGPINSLSDGL